MSFVQPTNKKFTQRNVFYLRASPYVVLQTILYLDYRHVEWFNQNPSVLTSALNILRTRIMPKLRKEADSSGKLSAMSKKERVDVYSDRDYQLAYFFRRTDDRHSVLLKEKSLVFPHDPTLSEVKLEDEEGNGNLHRPIPRRTLAHFPSDTPAPVERENHSWRVKDSPETSGPGSSSTLPASSATEENDVQAMPPPPITRRPRETVQVEDDDDTQDQDGSSRRRSKRVRIDPQVKEERDSNQVEDIGALQDADFDQTQTVLQQQQQQEEGDEAENAAIEITEEDEEKMKPKLSVKYAGFRIFGKLLVLVIEPSKRTIAANPGLFGAQKPTEVRQLSVAPVSAGASMANNRSGSVQTRFTSLEPSSSRNAAASRGPTPLFRGFTPAESEAGTPAPFQPSPSPFISDNNDANPGSRENSLDPSSTDYDNEATIGELEGIELATQMLEREEQTFGGNDIEDGD